MIYYKLLKLRRQNRRSGTTNRTRNRLNRRSKRNRNLSRNNKRRITQRKDGERRTKKLVGGGERDITFSLKFTIGEGNKISFEEIYACWDHKEKKRTFIRGKEKKTYFKITGIRSPKANQISNLY